MASTPPYSTNPQAQTTYQLSQQQTIPHAPLPYSLQPISSTQPLVPSAQPTKRTYTRIIAITIAIVLAIALYLIWHSPTTPTIASPPSITQQNFSTSSPTTHTNTNTSADIQVYIVGAVKHPGVYPLPAGSRVYQVLQAAGGPLPNANLVALNMAAKLSDGQEIYVPIVGETPPNYTGGVPAPSTSSTNTGPLVNINTASAAEMQQSLHISSKTAQKIVDYRTQHGNYTSVADLLQVVSGPLYKKIKDAVTVS